MFQPCHDAPPCTGTVADVVVQRCTRIVSARRHPCQMLVLALGLLTAAAHADTLVVTTNNDDGPGSLRSHILSANASGTPQQIEFIVTGVIAPTSLLPAITGELTIQGPGIDSLALSGSNNRRILEVAAGAKLKVLDLTLEKGVVDYHPVGDRMGGGVLNHGELVLERVLMRGNLANRGGAVYTGPDAWTTVRNSELTNNWAEDYGGALYTDNGRIDVLDSLLKGNKSLDSGAAIAVMDRHDGGVYSLAQVRVIRSTVTNNEATSEGGGLYNQGQQVIIEASTFDGNVAYAGGGGIRSKEFVDQDATLHIYNSTFSNNLAPNTGHGTAIDTTAYGSGQANLVHVTVTTAQGWGGLLRGRISARNSLIAASVGASCQYETLVTDLGGNLATDDSCQGFGQATLAELALAPLADNGGPTWTHALKPGSAAIDSIAGCDVSEPVASHDQRGVARPVDGDGDGIALCDVGAYEANDLLFGNGF